MEYTYYGNSGLRVSKIGLGLMKVSNTNIDNATKIFEYAYKKVRKYLINEDHY